MVFAVKMLKGYNRWKPTEISTLEYLHECWKRDGRNSRMALPIVELCAVVDLPLATGLVMPFYPTNLDNFVYAPDFISILAMKRFWTVRQYVLCIAVDRTTGMAGPD